MSESKNIKRVRPHPSDYRQDIAKENHAFCSHSDRTDSPVVDKDDCLGQS